ncbi:hypothetical protein K432DRAFT_311486, partial [Lepidopterella palustris CBS 459.81]
RRLEEYRAPSWSWASIYGNVDFIFNVEPPAEYRAEIIYCAVQQAGLDPFGQVSGGELIIREHMKQAPQMR